LAAFPGTTEQTQAVSATDTQLEAVRTAVEPAVAALGLAVYDVELVGGTGARTLRLTVSRPGGVDLDAITEVTRAVSPIVDEAATIGGPFLLEVSSPGVERALRRPEHYASAVGEEVSVKVMSPSGPRRVRGVLRAFDGARCVVASDAGDEEAIAIGDVTQARTVFTWGPQPRGRTAGHAKQKQRARAKGKS
jgi:ribosome maturation factor RimP